MNKWIGDKNNGLNIRYADDKSIDEIVLYQNAQVIMHMEATSMVNYWFGFYLNQQKGDVHMNIHSNNLKSHILAEIEIDGE